MKRVAMKDIVARAVLFLSCGVAAVVVCISARADEFIPLPSVADYTRGGDGLGLAIGAAVEFEPSYDGSDEFEFEFQPAGAVQWRSGDHMLFWEEGNEAGWRLRLEQMFVQLGVRYELEREADDSERGRLDGLMESDDAVVGVLEMRRALDSEWKHWVGGRIVAGEIGALGVLAVGKTFGKHAEVFTYATFADDEYNNRDFGVSLSESISSGYSQFDAGVGWRSFGLTGIYRRFISENVEIVAQGGIEFYSGDLSKSPLARKNYEPEVSLSVFYVF